ncbi:MAG: hypothetical protein KGL74_09785 [Elusimicrobia bacterium]|nr:hypothetical protein [Elusimicrobiota bacterium]
MKTKMKWLGAAALTAALMTAGRAGAVGVGSPSYLNIDVTIASNLSVSVSNQRTSSMSTTFTTAGAAIQAASTATVTNDTGYLAERWELSAPASAFDSPTGAAGWTIGTTAGNDVVKLQAVFGAAGTANTACSGATFGSSTIAPALTSATQTPYTTTILADSALGGYPAAQPDNTSTLKMTAGSSRALCWQLTLPTSTSFTGTQVVPIIVTAF